MILTYSMPAYLPPIQGATIHGMTEPTENALTSLTVPAGADRGWVTNLYQARSPRGGLRQGRRVALAAVDADPASRLVHRRRPRASRAPIRRG